MAPYDRSRTRSYSYSIVTMAYLVPFLPRDAMHRTDYAVARCPSVCPSHVGILPKWLNISSNFFYHRVATHPSFSTPNGMAIFRRAPPPLNGANLRGMKTCDFRSISAYLRNDARQSHSYYGRRIGDRTQGSEWCHFQ